MLGDARHAEVAILGAMLLGDVLAVADATATLAPEDFALDSHQRAFRTMKAMAARGEAIDSLTVSQVLRQRKELDSIGGMAYLMELENDVPRGMSIASYVRIVQDEAMARRALGVLQEAQRALMERSEPSVDVLDRMSHALAHERVSQSKHVSEVLAVVAQEMEAPTGMVLSTGVRDLDTALQGGYRTQELAIIGAFPSGGKSALVRQTERAALKSEIPAHSFSIEIADKRWVRHHAGREAGLAAWKTRELDKLNVVDRAAFVQGMLRMDSWPYYIDDAAGLTIDSLLARARLSVMRYGTKLFTVDFLQLLIQNHAKEVAEIADIVWRLKRFAKEYDVAVVALSQLTEDRGSGHGDSKPRLNQMRGSGAIRQAADVVVLCYRPEDETGNKTGDDELIVGKQRDGVTGPVLAKFNPETLCFEGRIY